MRKNAIIVLLAALMFLASCSGENSEISSPESEVSVQEEIVETSRPQEEETGVAQAEQEEEQISTNEQEVTEEQNTPVETISQTEEGTIQEASPALAGAYTAYDESLIGARENTFIFFGADWCPGCVVADKNLSESYIPAHMMILKADYDTDIDLRQKYGVVAQHTFVQVDSEGNEIRKWVGGYNVQDILERIN